MERRERQQDLLLTDEECREVEGSVGGEAKEKDRGALILVGSLLTNRPFNAYALKAIMKGAWKLKNGFVFRELRTNLFLFQFVETKDKEKILEEGPWSFDRYVLVLKEPWVEQPSKITIEKIPFWVRVYDLPLEAMTKETAMVVGKLLMGWRKWMSRTC